MINYRYKLNLFNNKYNRIIFNIVKIYKNLIFIN